MRKILSLITLLFAVPLVLAIALVATSRLFDGHSLPPAPTPATVVLDNVNLVPISREGIEKSRKVIIENGRITAIEPAGPPHAAGMKVLDMQSRYMAPGLTDMHVHIDDREQLRLALAHGVTAVRNMDGMPFHIRWKEELVAGEWLGSRLYSSSPILHGEQYSSFIDIIVEDAQRAKTVRDQLATERWDSIKIYSGLSVEAFKVIADKEATQTRPIVGHVPYPVVRENYLLASNMQTLEHVEEIFQGPLEHDFDEQKLAAVINDLAAIGAVVCPTLATFENLTRLSVEKSSYLSTLPTGHMTAFGEFFRRKIDIDRWLAASVERGEYNARELIFLQTIVKQLDEKQVRLVLGTDAGTNFVQTGPSVWQEMRLMLNAGMTPASVLRSATLTPAEVLGVDRDYGSVDVGKIADFVLTELNPIETPSTLSDIGGLVIAGNYLNREDLETLRSGEGRVAGWWRSVARYLDAILVRKLAY